MISINYTRDSVAQSDIMA